MAPKLYKASDVCEMTELQPYVLRSWESEFPGIGVRKSSDSPRLYRESDVEQVLRIKQLVFGEGLTLAGARRRLEDGGGTAASVTDEEVAEVMDALGAAARARIGNVRQALRSILQILGDDPGAPEPASTRSKAASRSGKSKTRASKAPAPKSRVALSRPKARVVAKPARAGKSTASRKGKRART